MHGAYFDALINDNMSLPMAQEIILFTGTKIDLTVLTNVFALLHFIHLMHFDAP